jgi:abequosyltransferase
MKISFCIPTYNHGRFLGAALDSILAQAPEDFEIVIVDGASTDNTSEVVAEYQRRTSAILYRRISVNRGIDPDLAETVAMAGGEYCWFMSSDDVIPAGAVARVLDALKTGGDLYIGARFVCTKELAVFGDEGVFAMQEGGRWDFSAEEALLDYLDRATGLIALFSYISVLVFRRDLWNSAGENSSFVGSCYAHAHRLWVALSRGGVVEFLAAPIVMCRMDTDNFASRGLFRRYMLDFDGYLGIADDVFGTRPKVRQAFVRAIQREHGLFRLAKFYGACADATQRRTALARLRTVGFSEGQMLFIQAVASTGPLVDLAVALRRYARRRFGRSRHQAS